MTGSISVKRYVNELSAAMSDAGVPAIVSGMEAYMKNRFEFYGVKSIPRKEVQKRHYAHNGLPDSGQWKEVVETLWNRPQRELHYAAMDISWRCRKHWKDTDLSFLEYLITSNSWWDTVDFVASTMVGYFFKRYPDQLQPAINRWKKSENMWLVRTSLIFQLKYKSECDFDLLRSIIKLHIGSKEFFINKAIGWSLRQHAYVDPAAVKKFVAETNLTPLSRREALKNL